MSAKDDRGAFRPLTTEGVRFHPVIHLPDNFEVYDFSEGYDPHRARGSAYGIGRYDERRPGMYAGEQFQAGLGDSGQRDIHVGLDIAAPVGEPVHAFYKGDIFKLGDNDQPYDYGPTIITRHTWLGQTVYALHGHLSRASLTNWSEGVRFEAGDVISYVGDETENGGWNPHVHFQLSLVVPETHDLPGAVSSEDRSWALAAFPDPRLVLGWLYE